MRTAIIQPLKVSVQPLEFKKVPADTRVSLVSDHAHTSMLPHGRGVQ